MKKYHLFHIPTHKSNIYEDVESLCNDLWGAYIWDYVLAIEFSYNKKYLLWDWNITNGDLNGLEKILELI